MQTIRCVLVGDLDAGKCELLITYLTHEFPTEYIPTVFDNTPSTVTFQDESYELLLSDAAGNEEYDQLRPLSYHQADVLLVCFSLVSESSFINVEDKWVPEIKHHCPETPFLIVGTGKHLRDEATNVKSISKKDGRRMAKHLSAIKYMECSAEKQIGVREVFDEAMVAVLSPHQHQVSLRRTLTQLKHSFRGLTRPISIYKRGSKTEGNNTQSSVSIGNGDEESVSLIFPSFEGGSSSPQVTRKDDDKITENVNVEPQATTIGDSSANQNALKEAHATRKDESSATEDVYREPQARHTDDNDDTEDVYEEPVAIINDRLSTGQENSSERMPENKPSGEGSNEGRARFILRRILRHLLCLPMCQTTRHRLNSDHNADWEMEDS